MLTDRELLELAAKAAGVEIKAVIGDTFWRPDGITWNPLIDDSDALRLAVSLQMGIHYESQVVVGELVGIVEIYHSHDGEGSCRCVVEALTDDPGKATRRAIVRAAAEIGGD